MNGGCTAHAKAFITAVAVAQHRDLGVKLRGIMLHERGLQVFGQLVQWSIRVVFETRIIRFVMQVAAEYGFFTVMLDLYRSIYALPFSLSLYSV